jgi:sulfate/thiosulfate transport system substrate-binding protein
MSRIEADFGHAIEVRHRTGWMWIRAAAVMTILAVASIVSNAAEADQTLLNVSYDPTRELYKALNPLFAADWKKQTGATISIQMSHGGSGSQARAVIDGLDADVVTLAVASDIDGIAQTAKLLPLDWQKRLPDNSTPYTSTIVFLVRQGNPKQIKDWPDLVKDGVQVITPNPKTSGAARWAFLAAWAWAAHQPGGDAEKAKTFVTALYQHVPVLATGARESTTTFVGRGIGDVLLSWENEAGLALAQLAPGQFEVVYPSSSMLAEPPVALVDKNVDRHGTRAVAEAYLRFLYTKPAQEIAARNHYRPRDPQILSAYAKAFPQIKLYSIDAEFGGWAKAQAAYFGDGAVFDQIYTHGH